METLERYLAEHKFFENLPKRDLNWLVSCASNVRFEAGKYIFREGESADKFYLIRHGKVAIEIAGPGMGLIIVDTLEEGDVLGWSWLIPPYRWRFDARAVELTRAIALDGACLRSKCEQDHDLGYELLKRFTLVMAARLEATRLQLLDLYGTKKK